METVNKARDQKGIERIRVEDGALVVGWGLRPTDVDTELPAIKETVTALTTRVASLEKLVATLEAGKRKGTEPNADTPPAKKSKPEPKVKKEGSKKGKEKKVKGTPKAT